MNDMGNNNFLIVLISNKCTNYFMKTEYKNKQINLSLQDVNNFKIGMNELKAA